MSKHKSTSHGMDKIDISDLKIGLTDVKSSKDSPGLEGNVVIAPRRSVTPLLHSFCVMASHRHGQQKDGVQHGPGELLTFYSCPPTHVFDANLHKLNGEGLLDAAKVSGNDRSIFRPKAVSLANHHLFDLITTAAAEKINKGHFPKVLTLGGDHSIAIGSISGITSALWTAHKSGLKLSWSEPDPIVIWVDAHADINTPKSTNSGSLHGCPLSLLAGIDKDTWGELKDFNWILDKIPPGRDHFLDLSHLAYIGLRDVEPFEQSIIDANQVVEYPMSKIKRNRNTSSIIQDILRRLDPEGRHPIHLSFDIDGIDPKYAPSTGTPVSGGLTDEEGVQIVRELFATGRLISMDIVEVNPRLGSSQDSQLTLETATLLIDAFCQSASNNYVNSPQI